MCFPKMGRLSQLYVTVFLGTVLIYLLLGVLFWNKPSSSQLQAYVQDGREEDNIQIKEIFPELEASNCKMTPPKAFPPQMEEQIQAFQKPASMISRARDCQSYFQRFPVKALQKIDYDPEFPIAFSTIVHKDLAIFELFLSLMYRPHNLYCVYVDEKVYPRVLKTIQFLVSCYQTFFATTNIFIFEERRPIFWGHYSILQADLDCLKHMSNIDQKWKYFMNTAGTELPNVPYATFEATAKRAQGHNIMDGTPIAPEFEGRINRYHTFVRYGTKKYDVKWDGTYFKIQPTPFGLRIFKGLKNVFLSREFANFSLYSPIAKTYRYWLEDIGIPDEIYFPTLATLVVDPEDRNNFYQNLTIDLNNYGKTRYSEWVEDALPCHGKMIRWMCNFGMSDLPRVWENKALMINKFNLRVDPLCPVCHWRHVWELDENR